MGVWNSMRSPEWMNQICTTPTHPLPKLLSIYSDSPFFKHINTLKHGISCEHDAGRHTNFIPSDVCTCLRGCSGTFAHTGTFTNFIWRAFHKYIYHLDANMFYGFVYLCVCSCFRWVYVFCCCWTFVELDFKGLKVNTNVHLNIS